MKNHVFYFITRKSISGILLTSGRLFSFKTPVVVDKMPLRVAFAAILSQMFLIERTKYWCFFLGGFVLFLELKSLMSQSLVKH